jgi:hypothetical protein
MPTALTVSPKADTAAERWRHWQLRNANSSRRTATRARVVFTIILTALGAWLGLQLLSSRFSA